MITRTALVMAAVTERLSYIVHRVRGRADDWGQPGTAKVSLLDGFQQVLRLATQCPAGPAGDDIRRAACELIEASSAAGRHTGRRRILKAIARVEGRRSRGRSRDDDPSEVTVQRLADALRRELRPG